MYASVQEFKACLQAAELSLTRQDVNLLMGRVDLNGDGLIDYAEFVPICFGIMTERFVDTVMRNTMLAASDQLQAYVLHCFRTFDVEGVLHLRMTTLPMQNELPRCSVCRPCRMAHGVE